MQQCSKCFKVSESLLKSCSSCHKGYCNECEKDLKTKCSIEMCNVFQCCEFEECLRCKNQFCKKFHLKVCHKCQTSCCINCSSLCYLNNFTECDKYTCLECQKEIKICSNCKQIESHENLQYCNDCSQPVCKKCSNTCSKCQKIFCKKDELNSTNKKDQICQECFLVDKTNDLLQYITSNSSIGTFYCSRTLNFLPLIKIKDWILSYPVTEFIYKKLKEFTIHNLSENIEKSIIDPNIKKLLELKNEFVKLPQEFLSSIHNFIINALSLGDKKLTFEFCNVLLFEKGSFYKPHRDVQSKDEFGTLFLLLPSFSQGGDLVINHLSQSKSFNFPLNSEEFLKKLKINWVAFFKDCEYEFKELTEGYHVALQFNIFYQNEDTVKTNRENNYLTKLEEIFKSLKGKKIGIILEHYYTRDTLTSKYLKGNDYLLYKTLGKYEKYSLKVKELEKTIEEIEKEKLGMKEKKEVAEVYFINENRFKIQNFVKNDNIQYIHAYIEIEKLIDEKISQNVEEIKEEEEEEDEEEEENEEDKGDEEEIMIQRNGNENGNTLTVNKRKRPNEIIEISDEEDNKIQKFEF